MGLPLASAAELALRLRAEPSLEERMNLARTFLMQFDASRTAELLGARSLIESVARESGTKPSELYDCGVLLNLRNAAIYSFEPPWEEKTPERLERAMIILETTNLTGETIEFFITYCLEWLIKQDEGLHFGAHYAQRAARLRTSGKLTRDEWDVIRNEFLRNPGKANNVFHAYKAHVGARGDTEAHFDRPQPK